LFDSCLLLCIRNKPVPSPGPTVRHAAAATAATRTAGAEGRPAHHPAPTIRSPAAVPAVSTVPTTTTTTTTTTVKTLGRLTIVHSDHP